MIVQNHQANRISFGRSC